MRGKTSKIEEGEWTHASWSTDTGTIAKDREVRKLVFYEIPFSLARGIMSGEIPPPYNINARGPGKAGPPRGAEEDGRFPLKVGLRPRAVSKIKRLGGVENQQGIMTRIHHKR